MSDSMNVTPIDANTGYPTITGINLPVSSSGVVAIPTQRDGHIIVSFPPWLLLIAGILAGVALAIYLMNSCSDRRCGKCGK